MDDKWGFLIVAGLLIGVLLMSKRNPVQAGYAASAGPSIKPRLNPSTSYDNEEVKDLEYNAEGYLIRITTHRHARAA